MCCTGNYNAARKTGLPLTILGISAVLAGSSPRSLCLTRRQRADVMNVESIGSIDVLLDVALIPFLKSSAHSIPRCQR